MECMLLPKSKEIFLIRGASGYQTKDVIKSPKVYILLKMLKRYSLFYFLATL